MLSCGYSRQVSDECRKSDAYERMLPVNSTPLLLYVTYGHDIGIWESNSEKKQKIWVSEVPNEK